MITSYVDVFQSLLFCVYYLCSEEKKTSEGEFELDAVGGSNLLLVTCLNRIQRYFFNAATIDLSPKAFPL